MNSNTKYCVYFRLFGNGEWVEDTITRKSLNSADIRGWRLHAAACDLQIAHGQFEWEIRDQSGIVYVHNGKWEQIARDRDRALIS